MSIVHVHTHAHTPHTHAHTPHTHAHTPHTRSDVISCSQLEEALAALKEISGEAKVKRIVAVLDTDSDGAIHLSEIAEVRNFTSLEMQTLLEVN